MANQDLYKYFCITEDAFITEKVDIGGVKPIKCKNSPLHIVNWSTLTLFYKALRKQELGLENVSNIKDNTSALVSPKPTDDITKGYSVGSRWINNSTNLAYLCVSNNAGSALWKPATDTAESINIGSDGIGIFKRKNGNELEFKNINNGSSKISITDNLDDKTVDIDIDILNLNDLTDINASDPNIGDFLKYNGSVWVNSSGNGGMNWKGTWSNSQTYIADDVVYYNSTAFICIATNINKQPPNLTYWNIVVDNPTGALSYFHAYDNLGNLTFSLEPITVNFDTISLSNDWLLNNGEVTAQSTDLFLFLIDVNITGSAGSSRSIAECYLEKNNGSEWIEIEGTRGTMYSRLSNRGDNSASISRPISVTIGDQYRVRVVRTEGSDTIKTKPKASRLSIIKLKAIKGDTGPPGPSGDISWMGSWSVGNYQVNHAVYYQGSSYLCHTNTTASQAPTNTNYWEPIALKGDVGPQGPPGDEGRPGATGYLDWQGNWTAKNYTENQAVYYQGESYICISNTINNAPPSNTAYWDKFAAKGEDGVDGTGGNLIVKSDMSNIVNTPHTSLSFNPTMEVSDVDGLSASVGVIFGSYYAYAEDMVSSSTSSREFIRRLRLTTPTIPSGTYRIGWHYTWSYSSIANNFHARVELDNSVTIHYHEQEPQDSGYDMRHSTSGFHHMALTPGIHTFDIDYKGDSSTSSIYESRLEFWRVA